MLVQINAVPTGHLHREEEAGGLESGPINDDIDRVRDAAFVQHNVRLDEARADPLPVVVTAR